VAERRLPLGWRFGQLVAKETVMPRCGFLGRDAAHSRRLPATVGEVGNSESELISVGKAGRSRWQGKRPSVRAWR